MYVGPPKGSIPLVRGVFSVLDPRLYLCTERGAGDREKKSGTLVSMLSDTDMNWWTDEFSFSSESRNDKQGLGVYDSGGLLRFPLFYTLKRNTHNKAYVESSDHSGASLLLAAQSSFLAHLSTDMPVYPWDSIYLKINPPVAPAARSQLAAAALGRPCLNAGRVTLCCSQHRADPAGKRHKLCFCVRARKKNLHA